VVVIGAGVIGLCLARALSARGWRVTVVERGEAGDGASRGNAGWVVPGRTAPVPGPGVVGTTLRSLRDPAAPLALRPSASPAYLRWLVDFWRHCNARDHAAGLAATAALNVDTLALFDRLRADGVAFESAETDILYAYRSAPHLERDLAGLAAITTEGSVQPVPMTGDALREREPALRDEVVGGYRLVAQRWVRPETLVAGLVADLRERGVEVRSQTRVTGFDRSSAGVAAVRTPQGPIAGDAVVLCAGVATADLARMLGVRLPIQAGKGYSLDYSPAPRSVTNVLYLDEARLAVTPFAGTLRVAGLMDLSSPGDAMPPARPCQVAAAAADYLRDWPTDPARATAWTGMRPLTPDGLPAIGRLPGVPNVAVAAGHAMLGITLAPATAEALAELLSGGDETDPDVLAPFDPARFVRRMPPHLKVAAKRA